MLAVACVCFGLTAGGESAFAPSGGSALTGCLPLFGVPVNILLPGLPENGGGLVELRQFKAVDVAESSGQQKSSLLHGEELDFLHGIRVQNEGVLRVFHDQSRPFFMESSKNGLLLFANGTVRSDMLGSKDSFRNLTI
jgi:hypothetical protein